MIDGLQLEVNPEMIQSSGVLNFTSKGADRKQAKYKGLHIDLYPARCFINGSLHKYRNNGKHNANDFTLSECRDSINGLSAELNINPETAKMRGIEFGVNVRLPIDPKDFINSIAGYKNKDVERTETGVNVVFGEYRVKIYRKDVEACSEPLLRFELKLEKMRKLKNITKSCDVFTSTLSDMANPVLWRCVGDELLSVFDGLIVADTTEIDVSGLPTGDAELLLNGRNAGYWDASKWCAGCNSSKEKKTADKRRERAKQRFNEVINKYCNTEIITEIRNIIEDKINRVIDEAFSPFGGMDSGAEMSQFHHLGGNEKMSRFHRLGGAKKGAEMSQFHRLDNWVKLRHLLPITTNPESAPKTPDLDPSKETQKRCYVTGLSLDIGIKQGDHLTKLGVSFYAKNYPDIYNTALLPRLSKKWEDHPEEIKFREIAHSIRNDKYNPGNNPRNNTLHSIRKVKEGSTNLLFSLEDTIREDKRQYLQMLG